RAPPTAAGRRRTTRATTTTARERQEPALHRPPMPPGGLAASSHVRRRGDAGAPLRGDFFELFFVHLGSCFLTSRALSIRRGAVVRRPAWCRRRDRDTPRWNPGSGRIPGSSHRPAA